MGTRKVLSDPQCMQNPKFTLQLSKVDGVTSILHVGLTETHPEPSTHCLCLCRVPLLSRLRTISRVEQRHALCQQGQARGHQGAASGALPLHCRASESRAFVRSDLSEGRRPVPAPECLRLFQRKIHLLFGVQGSPALLKPLQV